MNVGRLIKELGHYNRDSEVVLSIGTKSDKEGILKFVEFIDINLGIDPDVDKTVYLTSSQEYK